MRAWTLLALVTLSGAAVAADVDHRGSWGIAPALGGHYDLPLSSEPSGGALRAELVATLALFEHEDHELFAGVALGWPHPLRTINAGVRLYFGREEWKTFSDVGAVVHFGRALALGPRLGLGVQYDLSTALGFFAAAHGDIAFGSPIRAGLSFVAGAQLRLGGSR